VASLPAVLPEMGAAIVPSASVVELMGPRRAPIVVTHPGAPAARAYAALWAEVRGALDGASADGPS
jgi:hypothetical protein